MFLRIHVSPPPFQRLLLLAATIAASAATLSAGCTQTDRAFKVDVPLNGGDTIGASQTEEVINIQLNIPANQTNSLTPVALEGSNSGAVATHGEPPPPVSGPWIWVAKFPTGDPKRPYEYKHLDGPTVQKIYDKDCPGSPAMDFSNTFPPSAQAKLARAAAQTTGATSGHASHLIDFADFNGDGNIDVVLAATGSVTVQLNDANLNALTVNQFQVGADNPFAIAADVNGDGYPDLVLTDTGGLTASDANGGLWVLLNNKDGTFGAPVQYPAGPGPYYVFAADVNGDGKLDLVASDSYTANIAILIGNGDGTFKAATLIPGGKSPGALVAADFNNDGHVDLAAIDGVACTILLFLGNGDGTFQQPTSTPGGLSFGDLVFADFNNDGFIDLAAAYAGSNDAIMFLNNGKGGFAPSPAHLLGGSPLALDFSDPTPAGFFLFSTDINTLQTVITPGDANGTLLAPQLWPTMGIGATALATGDINGDGLSDAVITDRVDYIASVLINEGNYSFKAPVTYSLVTSADATPSPSAAALVALRPGAKPDLVVADKGALSGVTGGVLTLLNNGNGTFGTAASFPAGANPNGMIVIDLNGDGNPDVAVSDAGSSPGAVSVLLGDGQGNFAAPVSYLSGQSGVAIASADVNGDGKSDLIAGITNASSQNQFNQSGSITVLLNAGKGTFNALTPVTAPTSLAAIVAGDFNGDGKVDLALIGNTIQILLGNGDGTFKAGVSLSTESGANQAVTADMNGDGNLDLVVAHCCGLADDTYLLGNGDGTFQPEVHFLSGSFPTALALANWNGGSLPDIAIADDAVFPIFYINEEAPGGVLLALPNWFGPNIVSGASFQAIPVAPQSIATAVGSDLATMTAPNQDANPPTTLGGTTVQITDFLGNTQAAPLFYVSPKQVNFELPSGLATGPASVQITAADGTVSDSEAFVQPVSPGIFMLNAAALAAAEVVQVSGTKQTTLSVYQVADGAVVPNPINLGSSTDQNILLLFGTGFRNAASGSVSVTFNGVPGVVQYAGAQGTFLGLDQANIVIPQNAGLHGDVVVAFRAAGLAANNVHLTFE
jgi:uncharacterized protein (TIGR03437 family)